MIPIRIIRYLNDFLILLSIKTAYQIILQNNLKYPENQSPDGRHNSGYRIFRDDTSAAVIRNGCVLSNLIAGQDIHMSYGGVVPELASRAHQANIVPVTDLSLKKAGVKIDEMMLWRLHVTGFAGIASGGHIFCKGFACPWNTADRNKSSAGTCPFSFYSGKRLGQQDTIFPFLCLLVSGGTQNNPDEEPFGDGRAGEYN
jgi:hypothetical protein